MDGTRKNNGTTRKRKREREREGEKRDINLNFKIFCIINFRNFWKRDREKKRYKFEFQNVLYNYM